MSPFHDSSDPCPAPPFPGEAFPGAPGGQGERELPRYRCHKVVWALQIARIEHQAFGSVTLHFQRDGFAPMTKDSGWASKHQPRVGGYWVRYQDGYESFSPPEAFEAGYTEITP